MWGLTTHMEQPRHGTEARLASTDQINDSLGPPSAPRI
jgi:hypothetical protein